MYTSPLTRARQTAEAVVRRHAQAAPRDASGNLAVQVVPELYEMDYGRFIGQGYAEVREEMDQVLDAWRMGFVDQAFPGGESAILAQHRIRPFAQRLAEQAAADTGDVAVVAHGRINRVLIATLTGAGLQRLEEFPQSNACITELEVQGRHRRRPPDAPKVCPAPLWRFPGRGRHALRQVDVAACPALGHRVCPGPSDAPCIPDRRFPHELHGGRRKLDTDRHPGHADLPQFRHDSRRAGRGPYHPAPARRRCRQRARYSLR